MFSPAAVAPAAAAAPLACIDTLYFTNATQVRSVSLLAPTATPVTVPITAPANSGSNWNQLGISAGGLQAIIGTSTSMIRHTLAGDATVAVAKPTGVAGGTVGSVNPLTGLHYYGAFGVNGDPADVLSLYLYNPAGNTAPAGPVLRVTTPTPPGANGDIAFDELGRLYIVAGSGASPFPYALYVVNSTIPTSGTGATASASELTRGNSNGATNGIAFASDGFLYLGSGTLATKANPITGVQFGSGNITLAGSTDLGSCATPSLVKSTSSFPDGRQNPTDQVTVTLTGNDYQPGGAPGTAVPPSDTSAGSELSAETGHAIVLPGQTYNVTQTGAGGTNLDEYVTTWQCTNLAGDVSSSGTGNNATAPIPTGTDGSTLTCAFANNLPVPSIDLVKTVDPTSFSEAGTLLTYQFDVRNTGNTVLNNYQVSDALSGLSTIVCEPALGSTLQPNGTASCEATYTTTADDVTNASAIVNSATVSGTPPTGQGATVSDVDSAETAFEAVPPTAVDDTASTAFNTSVWLEGSRNDTPGNAPIDRTLTVFTSSAASSDGKQLVTAEGEWLIQADGRILFTPAAGYSGTTPSIEYRVFDENGESDTGVVSITVQPGPVSEDDSDVTTQDQPVTFSLLENDVAGLAGDGSEGSFTNAQLRFDEDNLPEGTQISVDGLTATVPGEGSYTLDRSTGEVTFDPEPTFIGTTTPIGYLITDANGNSSGAVITVEVTAVPPTALDDQANTSFNTLVRVNPLANDVAGPGGALVGAQTVFTSPDATEEGKALVTDEGTWRIEADGTVLFTPNDGFTGPTEPVGYRATDENGQTAEASISITVRPGPTAQPDTETTLQNQDVTFGVLGNDVAGLRPDGSAGEFDAESFRFEITDELPADSEVTNDGLTLTVPGEGTYTFDPATGAVTFDPEAAFSGVATAVTYTVTDQAGSDASTTITVTVSAVTPTAIDDAAKTPGGVPVVLDVTGNDSAGGDSAPLVPSTVRFTSPDATDDGTRLVIDGEGTWTVEADGQVRFVPVAGFEATTSPVEYSVADENGTIATANITVVVGKEILVAADTGQTIQGSNALIPVLNNDIPSDLGTPCTEPGEPAGCDTGTLIVDSVIFPTDGQPDGAIVDLGGKRITVKGEGVYVISPTDGSVVFIPEPQFFGTTTPITYSVRDSLGSTASATITVVVEAVIPVANDDRTETTFNVPVEWSIVENDTEGHESAPLQLGLTRFPAEGQPEGAVISEDGKTIVIAGEGSYVLDNEGNVLFSPVDGYSGTTTPVTYRIEDSLGTTADATIGVTVRPGPSAQSDSDVTLQGAPVTLTVLGNDTPSVLLDGSAGEWATDSVIFSAEGQPEGAEVQDEGKTLVVPGEGSYRVNDDGTVTFTPELTFSGPATPVAYEAADVLGNRAGSTISIDVTPVIPTASNNSASTAFRTIIGFDLIENDAPGDPSVPLDATSLTFEEADLPEGLDATISDDGRVLTVVGEGVYALGDNGSVLFIPDAEFAGVTTPVTYTVRDANGTPATATITVTVAAGPVAAPDAQTTPQGVAVAVTVLGNDTPGVNPDGSAGSWALSSVTFSVEGQPEGSTTSEDGKTLTVPGEGVYVIDGEGVATFTPEPAFRGAATPVAYGVRDALGNTTASTITITVTGIDPIATDDAAATPFGKPVVLAGLLSDAPGAESAPLVPAGTVFPAEGQPASATVSDDGKTVTVAGEGVYVINDNGSVTFTPAEGFEGATTPVTYRIVDTNGTTAQAVLAVIVSNGPIASPDVAVTPQNVTVSVSVLVNDSPAWNTDGSQGTWDASSVVFPLEGQPEGASVSDDGKTLTIPGEGVYSVGADGVISFDPEPAFTGVATPVTYAVTDSLGNTVTAPIAITVTPIAPVATDDSAVTTFGTPVVLRGATNDLAGADSAPIVAESTLFGTDGQPAGAVVSEDGKTLTIADEGSYAIQPDGSILFTPAAGFTGVTTPVAYTIVDANGTTDVAQLTVTVQAGPTAEPNTATTLQGTPVTLSPLGNDVPGLTAGGAAGTWDLASLAFPTNGQPAGAVVADNGRSLELPGIGTFVIDPATGDVTFTPVADFAGVVPTIAYTVTDANGAAVRSTIDITVTAVTPIARDDADSTTDKIAVTIDVLENDAPGAPSVPLDPSTLGFIVPGGIVTAVDEAGVGQWSIVDGAVVFTPVLGYSGEATIDYSIADTNGTRTSATIVVTVTTEAVPTPGPTVDPTPTPTVDPTPTPTPAPGLALSGSTMGLGIICLALLLILGGFGLIGLRMRRS